jgi:hypothetical protein
VDNFLESLLDVSREDLLNRCSSLIRYIDDFCGEDSGDQLFRILSQALPDLDVTLKQIKDDKIRIWLKQLNAKYISLFEGIYPPIPNDWYRILWTTKIDVTHGNIPMIETTILKRNGESVFLEMPFLAMITLINHLLRQICETKEINVREIAEILDGLNKTREIVARVLT